MDVHGAEQLPAEVTPTPNTLKLTKIAGLAHHFRVTPP